MGEIKNWATHYGLGVHLLDAEPSAPDDTSKGFPRYKWIHCANEGLYEGHHQGPFELTREVFDAFVRNFRAHPQYKTGALELGGGVMYNGGVNPVIQFDYEHASECPPWEGTIPQSGAPACGWVLDLNVRNTNDGRAQLWAFGDFGDELRAQITARKQRWVSIAFALQAIHWITKAPLGPLLTSIAITNHPFMLDLEPLAAANRQTSQPARAAVPSSGKSTEAPVVTREPTRTGATMDDTLRARICRALKIQTLADDAAVGAAVEEAVTGNGSLKSLLEALGVGKVDEALAAIPELRSAREKLAGLLSELDSLLAQEMAADGAVATNDVSAAMRAGKLTGTGAQEALVVHRKSFIDGEVAKIAASKKPGETLRLSEHRAARDVGRKAFLAKYGVADADKLHLSTSIVAGPNGQQLTPPSAPLTIEQRHEGEKPVVDLRGVPGPNPTIRYQNHLRATDKSFAALPHAKQIQRVSELRRTVTLQLE